MKDLYANNPVNQYRLKTDRLFVDYENNYLYRGFMDDSIRYIEEFQLLSPVHWRRFVQQFREEGDFDKGWKGDYWGKMMRGACFVYGYNHDEKLYDILTKTVEDMIESASEDGRISAYTREGEFDGWDLWCRKYVLLGMQYYLEICKDEKLAARIIESMKGQADYIMTYIGHKSDGKKPIAAASRNWRGLNSCSILEPVIRLYMITKEEKYFDFATYIVGVGGTEYANLFELAYKNEIPPYQYPITKAYEMTSCFEGLLEYYRVTGEEKHLQSVINFADRVLETDFTVIGSCGCTHELFDHSTVRQANTTNGKIAQETCVTVTLMKFFYQVHLITGDPKYVDAFEVSLYNAYLGAINTEKVVEEKVIAKYKERHPDIVVEPLPFDSYSPLTAGTRGNGIGGLQRMKDEHYYGCCACIGSAGIGLVPKLHLLSTEDGFVCNLYINGDATTTTAGGNKIVFKTETDYPKGDRVVIKVEIDKPESFVLKLRNPEWSKTTAVAVNGKLVKTTDGYITIDKEWQNGDVIEMLLDMRTKVIRPIPYEPHFICNQTAWAANYMYMSFDHQDPIALNHLALRRGPVTLAQENRLGYSVDEPVEIAVGKDDYVDVAFPETDKAPYKHIVELQVPLADGSMMTVTDYASAGKLWNEESKMAAWMLIK